MTHRDKHTAISEDLLQTLVRDSIDARQRAYAPYSKFLVGAAILGANGKVRAMISLPLHCTALYCLPQ